MRVFDYQPRTRIIFGPKSIERLGEAALMSGGTRVLVVSDPGIVTTGYTRRAVSILQSNGLEAFEFSALASNPTTSHVTTGLAAAREHQIDLIVGLGGGSSIDCAKGINFLLSNGGEMKDYWGVERASKSMLPLIAIPTTAGTGSEAQSFALITDEKTGQKMACGDLKATPTTAVLDPELTLTQPFEVTAFTGIDAICHSVEAWVTTKRNPISEVFARQAWLLLSSNFPLVIREPNNLEVRSSMLLGSYYAGMAIENSMLGAAHSCANPLTAHHGVTHGAAVGMMLPAVIRFNAQHVGSLYTQLNGSFCGAGELAKKVENWMDLAKLPTRLREYEISQKELPQLARDAAREWTIKFNPRAISVDELVGIYKNVY